MDCLFNFPIKRVNAMLRKLLVILISIQIGYATAGLSQTNLEDLSLIHFMIACFGMGAIASGSQSSRLTNAVLLFCAILLDVSWFILFSNRIPKVSSEVARILIITSIAMEILGFCLRIFSSLVWIQMLRLPEETGSQGDAAGVSQVDPGFSHEDPNDATRRRLLPEGLDRSNDASDDEDSRGVDPADTNILDPNQLNKLMNKPPSGARV